MSWYTPGRHADLEAFHVVGRSQVPVFENDDGVRPAHEGEHLQPARLDVAAHEREDALRHAGFRHQRIGNGERQLRKPRSGSID